MEASNFKQGLYGTAVSTGDALRSSVYHKDTSKQDDPGTDLPPQPLQNHLKMALFSILFCPLLGFVAIACSLRSRSCDDAGKTKEAIKFGKITLGFIIVSIVVGCILLAFLLAVYLQCGPHLCTVSDTNKNIAPHVACNLFSPEYNYYTCFDIIHSCNPQVDIYDPVTCAKSTNDDICSPFSPQFAIQACAKTELKAPCNPFLRQFNVSICPGFDETVCVSMTSSYDRLACFFSVYDPDECQTSSASYDVYECIRKTINSGPLAQACNPLSPLYDVELCLADGGLSIVPD